MYLALHRFSVGPFAGLVVATGLPRPSTMKKIWREMFLEFDEILHKNLTDPDATRFPGLALVPAELATISHVELARTHCARKYEKIFQKSLTLGVCVGFEGSQNKNVYALQHPAFSFGYLDARGDLNELRLKTSTTPIAWNALNEELGNQWFLSLKNLAQSKGTLRELEVSVTNDRCFRLAPLVANPETPWCFSFGVGRGKLS